MTEWSWRQVGHFFLCPPVSSLEFKNNESVKKKITMFMKWTSRNMHFTKCVFIHHLATLWTADLRAWAAVGSSKLSSGDWVKAVAGSNTERRAAACEGNPQGARTILAGPDWVSTAAAQTKGWYRTLKCRTTLFDFSLTCSSVLSEVDLCQREVN